MQFPEEHIADWENKTKGTEKQDSRNRSCDSQKLLNMEYRQNVMSCDSQWQRQEECYRIENQMNNRIKVYIQISVIEEFDETIKKIKKSGCDQRSYP